MIDSPTASNKSFDRSFCSDRVLKDLFALKPIHATASKLGIDAFSNLVLDIILTELFDYYGFAVKRKLSDYFITLYKADRKDRPHDDTIIGNILTFI